MNENRVQSSGESLSDRETAEKQASIDVYYAYAEWLPENQVMMVGGRLLPIENFTDEEGPAAEQQNAEEARRIQQSYLDYVLSLPPVEAKHAAQYLLGLEDWNGNEV